MVSNTMFVVYINNDKVRHFITCDSDMMSPCTPPLRGAGKRVLQLSAVDNAHSCVLGAWLCKDSRQKGVGVNEIMSCVYFMHLQD